MSPNSADRSPDLPAKQFNDRLASFNFRLRDVLEEVMLGVYPKLHRKVLTVETAEGRRRFPVVPLGPAPGNSDGERIISISPRLTPLVDSGVVDQQFITYMRMTGRKLWDNDVYRLLSINGGELEFGLTRFFKVLSSSDCFLYELVRSLPADGNASLESLRDSELLRRWRETVQRLVEQGAFQHLSAAVGVSVLTVFQGPGKSGKCEYGYLSVENSKEKNGAKDRHVIPSFILEPFTKDPVEQSKELSLEYQVLREFGEEIVGLPELRSITTWEAAWHILNDNETCRDLIALLRTSGAKLVTTGVSLDLLRLRPEITCVLLILDPDYFQRNADSLRGSWENTAGVTFCRLRSRREYERLLLDEEVPMCPAGTAALVGGREFALKYLSVESDEG